MLSQPVARFQLVFRLGNRDGALGGLIGGRGVDLIPTFHPWRIRVPWGYAPALLVTAALGIVAAMISQI
jgi:hypothetical protein